MRRIKLCFALFVITLISACTPGTSSPTPTPAILDTPEIRQSSNYDLGLDTFANVSEGRIPVIYSHGGAPCDIGGMVFFAKHPQVDLIGLVLSRGEFYPQQAVRTWPVFLFDVLGSTSTKIAIGTQQSLDPNPHEFPEAWRTLSTNFWNLELPPQSTEFTPEVGHELIIDLVSESPDKVTIIAMGAMTDVALALQEAPEIIDNISHVVVMGGAFNVPGNLSDGPEPTNNTTAEWNMYIDSAAAKFIFDSGVPVSIVPLDAIQYFVNANDLYEIRKIDDPGVSYVSKMWDQQIGWGGDFLIWDTITATAVTNPENFYWIVDGVDVITTPGNSQGRTIPLNNGAQHIRYATGADYEKIMDLLFEIYRTKEAQQTTESQPLISGFGGVWEGETDAGFSIIFSLESDCEMGVKCGTFEIPDFSLSGDVVFVAVNDEEFEFLTSNLSYPVESEIIYEYLRLLPDGTLKYRSEGIDGTNESILLEK